MAIAVIALLVLGLAPQADAGPMPSPGDRIEALHATGFLDRFYGAFHQVRLNRRGGAGVLHVTPSLSGAYQDVEIDFVWEKSENPGSPWRYVVRRRSITKGALLTWLGTAAPNPASDVELDALIEQVPWTYEAADSASCRALMPMLHRLKTLRPDPVSLPEPGPRDYRDTVVITADGTGFELDLNTSTDPVHPWRELEHRAILVGGPAEAWGEAFLEAMKPCWRPAAKPAD